MKAAVKMLFRPIALAGVLLASAAHAQNVPLGPGTPSGSSGGTYAALLGQSHVPMILPSSGSMGNNGALTLTTALPVTYATSFVYMPAGAIAAGSVAGYYPAVFTSGTAATVYNNVYTSGTPVFPASPTPFVTTGPGAYTQTTATNLAAYKLTVAGNLIGANGCLNVTAHIVYPNNANSKVFTGSYSTYAFGNLTITTTVQTGVAGGVCNLGVTNIQGPQSTQLSFNTVASTGAITYGAIDSTSSQTLFLYERIATATDYMIMDSANVQLVPGVP